MENMEWERLERIARQAMNIQVMEMEYMEADDNGRPIQGSEYIVTAIYNLENISAEEVRELAVNGMIRQDDRVVMTDPVRFAHIFPHRGESKRDVVPVYWKSRGYAGDDVNVECSMCGFTVPANEAKAHQSGSGSLTKYRFCPNCGARMMDI